MIKHLTAIGNSLGIIIDKPILEILGIDKDTPLEVKTDGEGLVIRPLPPGSVDVQRTGRSSAQLRQVKRQPSGDAPIVPPLPIVSPSPVVESAPPPPAVKPSPPVAVKPSPPPARFEAPSTAAMPHTADDAVPTVVVELRDEEILRVPLEQKAVVLGRDRKCEIHLDDRALSRRHAQIEWRGASLWVQDLGSANGTFVNGEEIRTATRLNGGDVIGVGHYRVRVDGLETAPADMPILTLNGPEGLHRFALVGEQIVIGRAQNCDISIGHKSISRRHLRIAVEGNRFVAEDLGSQNGIKINGKRATGPTELKVGDTITICEFTLELGFLDAAANGNADSKGKPSTMLIDRSRKTAYVEGDFSGSQSVDGNLALGGGQRPPSASRGLDTGDFQIT